MLLKESSSQLIVVDIQERLLPAIHKGGRVVENAVVLLKAADELQVPVMVSQQYPKGLGPTDSRITDLAENARVLDKITFSCLSDEVMRSAVEAEEGRRQLVICGTEAHVCVMQTAMEAKQLGYEVFVVADASSSRKVKNRDLAFDRMRANGIEIVATEMVLFEWMHKAGTDSFKTISQLIK